MSDDDRLADYVARQADPNHLRTLPDGCVGCGQSVVSCNCHRYIEDTPCCGVCSH